MYFKYVFYIRLIGFPSRDSRTGHGSGWFNDWMYILFETNASKPKPNEIHKKHSMDSYILPLRATDMKMFMRRRLHRITDLQIYTLRWTIMFVSEFMLTTFDLSQNSLTNRWHHPACVGTGIASAHQRHSFRLRRTSQRHAYLVIRRRLRRTVDIRRPNNNSNLHIGHHASHQRHRNSTASKHIRATHHLLCHTDVSASRTNRRTDATRPDADARAAFALDRRRRLRRLQSAARRAARPVRHAVHAAGESDGRCVPDADADSARRGQSTGGVALDSRQWQAAGRAVFRRWR